MISVTAYHRPQEGSYFRIAVLLNKDHTDELKSSYVIVE